MSSPQDGPATKFIPDPHLIKIQNKQNQNQQQQQQRGRGGGGKGTNNKEVGVGNEFGLVLVAGWPPNIVKLQKPYHQFLEKVKQCFDEIDFKEENPLPNVYLYPAQHLHITIATLRAFTHPTPSVSQQAKISKFFKNLVISASKQEGWPKSKFTLEINGAQIGEKAGILLWNETSGNLDAMRACLSKELENHRSRCDCDCDCGSGCERSGEYGPFGTMGNMETASSAADRSSSSVGGEQCVALDTVFIPRIVHSTFLRFSDEPKSDGMKVQTKFGQLLSTRNDKGNIDCSDKDVNDDNIGDSEDDSKKGGKSKLSELRSIFKESIEIDFVRLVNERTPYMHIPCDEDHVLHSFELT